MSLPDVPVPLVPEEPVPDRLPDELVPEPVWLVVAELSEPLVFAVLPVPEPADVWSEEPVDEPVVEPDAVWLLSLVLLSLLDESELPLFERLRRVCPNSE